MSNINNSQNSFQHFSDASKMIANLAKNAAESSSANKTAQGTIKVKGKEYTVKAQKKGNNFQEEVEITISRQAKLKDSTSIGNRQISSETSQKFTSSASEPNFESDGDLNPNVLTLLGLDSSPNLKSQQISRQFTLNTISSEEVSKRLKELKTRNRAKKSFKEALRSPISLEKKLEIVKKNFQKVQGSQLSLEEKEGIIEGAFKVLGSSNSKVDEQLKKEIEQLKKEIGIQIKNTYANVDVPKSIKDNIHAKVREMACDACIARASVRFGLSEDILKQMLPQGTLATFQILDETDNKMQWPTVTVKYNEQPIHYVCTSKKDENGNYVSTVFFKPDKKMIKDFAIEKKDDETIEDLLNQWNSHHTTYNRSANIEKKISYLSMEDLGFSCQECEAYWPSTAPGGQMPSTASGGQMPSTASGGQMLEKFKNCMKNVVEKVVNDLNVNNEIPSDKNTKNIERAWEIATGEKMSLQDIKKQVEKDAAQAARTAITEANTILKDVINEYKKNPGFDPTTQKQKIIEAWKIVKTSEIQNSNRTNKEEAIKSLDNTNSDTNFNTIIEQLKQDAAQAAKKVLPNVTDQYRLDFIKFDPNTYYSLEDKEEIEKAWKAARTNEIKIFPESNQEEAIAKLKNMSFEQVTKQLKQDAAKAVLTETINLYIKSPQFNASTIYSPEWQANIVEAWKILKTDAIQKSQKFSEKKEKEKEIKKLDSVSFERVTEQLKRDAAKAAAKAILKEIINQYKEKPELDLSNYDSEKQKSIMEAWKMVATNRIRKSGKGKEIIKEEIKKSNDASFGQITKELKKIAEKEKEKEEKVEEAKKTLKDVIDEYKKNPTLNLIVKNREEITKAWKTVKTNEIQKSGKGKEIIKEEIKKSNGASFEQITKELKKIAEKEKEEIN
ncbi:MAG: hypothetical protein LBB11_01595 [Puniceicoccales bacterium]|jgi:hypothetical protein|nr:hypothetical protein [Puniceicoccales bacterium]